MSYPQNPPRRAGFTLVELLVVILIISLLVALLAAGVMGALRKADDVKVTNDLTQLASSIRSFKDEYKVDYLPSRFVLHRDLRNYPTSAPSSNINTPAGAADWLAWDSRQYLQTMFPRMKFTSSTPVNWGGRSADAILQGDECLVFFLGGIQSTVNGNQCNGFANSDDTPDANTTNKRGPHYTFPLARLKYRDQIKDGNDAAYTASQFFVYVDPFGTAPYAYFSNYKTQNSYGRYASASVSSDCSALNLNPFQESTGRFANWESFQIICANRNGLFGQGGKNWAGGGGLANTSGQDDRSNFSSTPLGVKDQ